MSQDSARAVPRPVSPDCVPPLHPLLPVRHLPGALALAEPAQPSRLRVGNVAVILYRYIRAPVFRPRLGGALLTEAPQEAQCAPPQELGIGGAQVLQALEVIKRRGKRAIPEVHGKTRISHGEARLSPTVRVDADRLPRTAGEQMVAARRAMNLSADSSTPARYFTPSRANTSQASSGGKRSDLMRRFFSGSSRLWRRS